MAASKIMHRTKAVIKTPWHWNGAMWVRETAKPKDSERPLPAPDDLGPSARRKLRLAPKQK